MSNNRKFYIFLSIILFIFVSVGVYFFLLSQKKINTPSKEKKLLYLGGFVDNKSPEWIKIKFDNPDLISEKADNLTFYIGKDTKFFKETDVLKDESSFKAEQAEFIKKINSKDRDIAEVLSAPSRYEEKNINFGDLAIGDRIEVYYFDNAGQKNAMRINLYPAKIFSSEEDLLAAGGFFVNYGTIVEIDKGTLILNSSTEDINIATSAKITFLTDQNTKVIKGSIDSVKKIDNLPVKSIKIEELKVNDTIRVVSIKTSKGDFLTKSIELIK